MASTVKTIKKYLDDTQAKAIRAAMLLGEDGNRKAEDAMEAINGILDGFGIESIRDPERWNRYWTDTAAIYVNMGDTYVPTVFYEPHENRFVIGDMEWWVLGYEKKYGVLP